ncbi:MAG: DUF502 domain-containing protein [Candidatus Zixiibacteriota bacterium]|nr:MAG: DUF502 domain-containing protein [candidate division Zixibacteria bacterium]
MSLVNRILGSLRLHFLSGVLVVVPIILTYIVLKFLFESLDGILQPILERLLGYSIFGLGVFTTILIIILAGILTRNFIGARLYRVGDRMLVRMPIIRPIYSAAKQLLEAVTMPTMDSFKEVALVEYPRRGAFALGFISNRIEISSGGNLKKYVSVFVPSTPTPVSGMVIVVPEEDVHPVQMTIEEGVKFLVSGGVASPALIHRKNSPAIENEKEVGRETR